MIYEETWVPRKDKVQGVVVDSDTAKKQLKKIEELKSSKSTATPQILITGGVILIGLLVIGSVASQIISGALAVAVAGVVGVGGLATLKLIKNYDPLIQQKLKNDLHNRMIEEAKANKIATLNDMLLRSKQKLKVHDESFEKMGGFVARLQDNIRNSDRNIEFKQQQLDAVIAAKESIYTNLKKAYAAHDALKDKVADYKDKHEFSQIISEANSYLNSSHEELVDLIGMELFDDIDKEFNEAMASIELETRKISWEDE